MKSNLIKAPWRAVKNFTRSEDNYFIQWRDGDTWKNVFPFGMSEEKALHIVSVHNCDRLAPINTYG